MIEWLLSSTYNQPELAHAESWPGLLSSAEMLVLSGLRLPKRRREWLLGRWTAKRLLSRWWRERTRQEMRLDDWTILAAPDGAPEAELPGVGRVAVSLSISHSAERALCALTEHGAVGADIERIEARSEEFVRDYLTAGEFALVERARVVQLPAATIDLLVMLIWSAKEAALKVARAGLREDTRSVEALPHLQTLAAGPVEAWTPLMLSSPLAGLESLRAWWRQDQGYVLTLATNGDEEPRPEPLASTSG